MRPCSGSKKWSGLQLELDVLDQPVVDHQRAEQRRLRLDILGRAGASGAGASASRMMLSAMARTLRPPAPV